MIGEKVKRVELEMKVWVFTKDKEPRATEPFCTVMADIGWKRGGAVTMEYPPDSIDKDDLIGIFQSCLEALSSTDEPSVVIRKEAEELED